MQQNFSVPDHEFQYILEKVPAIPTPMILLISGHRIGKSTNFLEINIFAKAAEFVIRAENL